MLEFSAFVSRFERSSFSKEAKVERIPEQEGTGTLGLGKLLMGGVCEFWLFEAPQIVKSVPTNLAIWGEFGGSLSENLVDSRAKISGKPPTLGTG